MSFKKSVYSAFSLIELMVVIAIVGLLAAVAVPSYNNYIIETRVANSYALLRSFADQLIVQYNTQGNYYSNLSSWPGQLTVNGQVITAYHPAVDINIGDIQNLQYYTSNTLSPDQSQEFILMAGIKGLDAIPGYVAPSGASYGQKALIRLVGVDNHDGTIQIFCGMWTNITVDIPAEYQPVACPCQDLNNVYTNGGTSC